MFLPFPEVLYRLGFSLASKCPACDSSDSMVHWFLHCSFARQLWSQVLSEFQLRSDMPDSLWIFLHDWWAIHCRPSAIGFFLPGIVCWVLWKARCSLLYSSQPLSSVLVLREVRSLAAALTTSLPGSKVVRPIAVYWHFPPPAVLKLNVDGSVLGNPGSAGAGIVLRDASGCVKAALSVSLGSCTNVEAEILAAVHGLRLVSSSPSFAGSRIILESDSKMLVDWLHLKLPWPWLYFHLLHSLSLAVSIASVDVVHTYREANSVADALAKMASSSKMSFSFQASDLPLHVRGLVALDQRQCPYVRYKL